MRVVSLDVRCSPTPQLVYANVGNRNVAEIGRPLPNVPPVVVVARPGLRSPERLGHRGPLLLHVLLRWEPCGPTDSPLGDDHRS